ncbi:MAG: iron donor protein CyaY [Betaproteobacteria bacterium]|jgi:CyaY protein|nr:iron donor protein CyaY [Betaproteobacteria bacterium]
MDESVFEALAETELARIERAFDASGVDADIEAKGDGVLEIEFSDGSKIIVNRHAAAREIWVAARSGGFHFRYDGYRWLNTRDGGELYTALSRLASEQSGSTVALAAPEPD